MTKRRDTRSHMYQLTETLSGLSETQLEKLNELADQMKGQLCSDC